ncbi:MAG: RHS repeat domain-containing protein, partial [Pseudanabaena sp.]
LSEKTLPNGVKTVYSYDELDQVSKIETKNGSGVVLASMTYERTGVGEPSKITREDGSYVTYGYDSALRLTKESYFNPAGALQNEITYGYDASGKRTAKNNQVYAYNNAYQLQTVTGSNGAETYGYDADGRVSAINRDGQTLILSHDSYDRLTQANDITYLYDGNGNRIKAVSGASERKFLQASNGGLAITELLTDAAGNVISDYVYGNGSTPIEKIDASGNSVYYLTDAMGSVIGEVDGDGNLITRIQYDGFGNVWSQSGTNSSASGGDFRFQGQWLESESGLYYFRARDYDAKTGLFLSRDAVDPTNQDPESMNPYQFAYQNPLIYSDPSGMITMAELNVSQVISDILNAARNYSVQEIKNYAFNKLGEGVTGIIKRGLETILPGGSNENKLLKGFEDFKNGSGVRPSTIFEQLATLATCAVFGNIPNDYLRFGVRYNSKNLTIPIDDGQDCDDVNKNGIKFPGRSRVSIDFMFKPTLPTQRLRDGWLVGDFKLSVQDLHTSYVLRPKDHDQGKQWGAIVQHARRYQYIPATLFITYNDGKSDQKAA